MTFTASKRDPRKNLVAQIGQNDEPTILAVGDYQFDISHPKISAKRKRLRAIVNEDRQ